MSDEVLDAVARALQLDEAERIHLFDLARAARPSRMSAPSRSSRRRGGASPVRSSVVRVVESITTPAFVRNGLLEVLVINPLARALYAPLYDDGPMGGDPRPVAKQPAGGLPNLARFCFLDPRARDLYPGWEDVAGSTVAVLRSEAGRDPYNRALTDLVGELATRSEFFRTAWAAHNVTLHQAGTKYFRHPVVGHVEVSFNSMELPADPGLTLTVYTTNPAPRPTTHWRCWPAGKPLPAASVPPASLLTLPVPVTPARQAARGSTRIPGRPPATLSGSSPGPGHPGRARRRRPPDGVHPAR
ncbi:MAG: transcriptional regulator [Streptosporangiaceae bacterium]